MAVMPNINKVEGMEVTDKAPADDKKTIEEKANLEMGKLQELAEIDTKPLMEVRGMFPFDFFPTILIIDRKKVTVIDKQFFFAQFTQSLLIEDLFNIQVQTGIVFSSLNLVDKHYPGETITVKYLPTSKAVQARRILDGLVIAQKEKIDLTYIPREELLIKLEEIGAPS